jgi:hypothetical protein
MVPAFCGVGVGEELWVLGGVGWRRVFVRELGFYGRAWRETGGGRLWRAGAEEVGEGHVEVGFGARWRWMLLGSGLVTVFGVGVEIETVAGGPKACGGHAHLHSGFGHAVEGIAASFSRWALIDHVSEDGRRSEVGEVYFIHGLLSS